MVNTKSNAPKSKPLTKIQRIKIKGAIEALTALLDHAEDHLFELDQAAVEHYLEDTKKVLKKGKQ